MPLKDKKVFVTGGTGGIGRPLVTLLQQQGANVTVLSRQEHGDLRGDLDKVCALLVSETPDILINLAGRNELAFCEDQDAEDLLALNLLAPIRLTQAVLPGMKKRGSGQIVNVGSMTALIPLPHLSVYVASKAGLKGFSDSLRRELGGSGVAVTHITPRAVKTNANSGIKGELNEKTAVNYDDPDYVARRIFDAICRKEADVRIGWPERLFAFLNAVCPSLIDKGLKKNRIIGEQILTRQKTQMEEQNEKTDSACRLAS